MLLGLIGQKKMEARMDMSKQKRKLLRVRLAQKEQQKEAKKTPQPPKLGVARRLKDQEKLPKECQKHSKEYQATLVSQKFPESFGPTEIKVY